MTDDSGAVYIFDYEMAEKKLIPSVMTPSGPTTIEFSRGTSSEEISVEFEYVLGEFFYSDLASSFHFGLFRV